jgi:hypothetical protein
MTSATAVNWILALEKYDAAAIAHVNKVLHHQALRSGKLSNGDATNTNSFFTSFASY